MPSSNSLQSFKQIEVKTPEILYFYFFTVLEDCVCDVIFISENEARNLQNGGVHLPQIPDFKMRYLENHLTH